MRDAPTTVSREVFVFGMAQRKREKLAVMKDAPTAASREVFVFDMAQR